MKKLPKQNLNDLFTAISAQQALYLPADDAAGQAQYTLWRDGMTLSRRHNTARSAKDLFFPQVENLMGFRVSEKRVDGLGLRHVEEVEHGSAACSLDLLHDGGTSLFTTTANDDFRALGSKQLRDALADSARRSSDNGYLILQAIHANPSVGITFYHCTASGFAPWKWDK